ncbi:MAG: hypothetical protein IT299_12215 [Dehalococcoidia bacterium]|nr:hypothetical protein [Dehalococcoidia bacterium]
MDAALQPWSSRQARQAALLLLLAWLPTLTFFGHWEGLAAPFTSASAVATHAHSPTSDREHAQHCHAGFEGCSGGASAVTMPAGAPAHAEVQRPEDTSTDFVVLDESPPTGFEASPLTPPPQLPA